MVWKIIEHTECEILKDIRRHSLLWTPYCVAYNSEELKEMIKSINCHRELQHIWNMSSWHDLMYSCIDTTSRQYTTLQGIIKALCCDYFVVFHNYFILFFFLLFPIVHDFLEEPKYFTLYISFSLFITLFHHVLLVLLVFFSFWVDFSFFFNGWLSVAWFYLINILWLY